MKALFMLLVIMMVTACGSFKSVTQLEESTYIQFVGNPKGVVFTLDKATQVNLGEDTKSFDLNGKTITKIVITPGEHEVKLERGGQLLMHRKLFVSEGNATEITIP